MLALRMVLCFTAAIGAASYSHAVVVDFDDLVLTVEPYWTGPDPNGVDVAGQFGLERHGYFESHGARFVNRYDLQYRSWNGMAFSNVTDNTTPGFMNQHSAITGSGRGAGEDIYAIASGYHDLATNVAQPVAFDPTSPSHLDALPYFEAPAGMRAQSVWVTNATYPALAMRDGIEGDFPVEKFGGPSGTDPDWFKLSAYGTDATGVPLTNSVEFYLADYRSSDPSEDYIIDEWTLVDLTPLAGAHRIHFNLSSSDVGSFGMNTPGYFALDDVLLIPTALAGDFNSDGTVDAADYTVWRDTPSVGAYEAWRSNYGKSLTPVPAVAGDAVPEPTAAWLCLMAGAGFLIRRKEA